MTRRGEVKLVGVGKSFHDITVLKDVNLEIRPGEFFSLLGPSGSGKTTTLRIIAGLEIATEGSVYLDGRDATLLPPADRDVAMVFQSYALYPHMTVFDNIAFPLRMIRTPKAEIAAAVRDA
ncbi:MAG TPA: ABC transporter ATP-binding protein, partial [Burkholderiales bacterium]|nr:ABC transporter ATP-binding protein [Burkholderiales bacterium]